MARSPGWLAVAADGRATPARVVRRAREASSSGRGPAAADPTADVARRAVHPMPKLADRGESGGRAAEERSTATSLGHDALEGDRGETALVPFLVVRRIGRRPVGDGRRELLDPEP